MATKKTTPFGRIGILFLFALHFGVILATLYFVWKFGHRLLVEPLAGTWDGLSEMPLQVKMYWGAMVLLTFSALFFVYKVFRYVRNLL